MDCVTWEEVVESLVILLFMAATYLLGVLHEAQRCRERLLERG